MFDIESSLDQQILDRPRNRPAVVFTEPDDPRVLEAVCHLTRFVRPVLLAPEKQVREVLARELAHLDPNRIEYSLSECAFVDVAERNQLLSEFAEHYRRHDGADGHVLTQPEALSAVAHDHLFGTLAVALGHADAVVGGARHESRAWFRPMVKLLAADPVLAEAGVFVLPDDDPSDVFPENLVVFADVGVNASFTPESLARVAVGTCVMARDLIPEQVLAQIRCAIVSYSNRGSDEGPSPELVRQATRLVPALLAERAARDPRYSTIQIEGEVKLSVALSQRSAMYYQHGMPTDWQEGANVIVCPNLDMGNLLYHLFATRNPSAKKFPVMIGVRSRGIDLAMDCTPEDVRLAVKAAVLRLHRLADWQRTPKDTFFRRYRVLAINPGSTSTKLAVYEGDEERFVEEVQHTAEELLPFEGKPITVQYAFRRAVVERELGAHDLGMGDIDAVAGRGGLLRPIAHGTYRVNDRMVADLEAGVQGEHASNLGALIARDLVRGTERPAFIVDPVVVDEAPNRVRICGLKELRRKVISHALNQIATARRYAEERETFYEKVNVIVCHMGGGITVGAHCRGRYVDVNDGLDGEGPFSPQRSGTLPVGQLIGLCFSGKYTQAELRKLNKGRGGLISLVGTADLREVERQVAAGDPWVTDVYDALAYRIAREIASLWPAFDGEPVDRILLTGGMARSPMLVERLQRHLAALPCGVSVYPGENEMAALAKGAQRVLSGREQAREYAPEG